MICSIKGKVLKILKNGFLVNTDHGEVRVKTQNSGWKLSLRPGDSVHVFGGPDADGFAVSSIYKTIPDGEDVQVHDESITEKFRRVVLNSR